MDQLDTNIKSEKQSKIKNITEASCAIILSHLAHESDRFELLCEKNKDVLEMGHSMEQYLYYKNAIHVHEQTFLTLKQLIYDLVGRLSTGSVSLYGQVAALAAIKLLKANLRGLEMCKMNLS